MFSKLEESRYSRHIKLDGFGIEAQNKLKEASVLCIGAGGLGATILQYLGSAGVGKITIIDGDIVEDSNLQRQVIFDTEDIGVPKALAAKIQMLKLNPYIEVEAVEEYLTIDNAIELCEEHDVIVDGSDNFQTRYLVNDACVITNKPFVYGAVYKFNGQVAVFNVEESATYRCLYPMPPTPGEMLSCGDVGVLGVLPGLIGCYQANEVIKIITGIGEPLVNKLLTIDTLTIEHSVFGFQRNETIVIDQLMNNYDTFCGVNFTGVTELKREDIVLADYYVIDVRTLQEYQSGHLEGAIFIPARSIQNKLEAIPRDKKVLVYCQFGVRSAAVVQKLQDEHSYTNLYSLEKGYVGLKI